MNLNTLFDKIAGRHHQRQHARKADFHKLVQHVADGKEPDDEFVDRVLLENDRTLEDLRGAVDLLSKRRGLRRTIDGLPDLRSERQELERQIGAAEKAFEEAEAHYDSVVNPLAARLDQVKRDMTGAEQAKQELERTCADEDLRSELEQVRQQLHSLSTQKSKSEIEANDLRTAAKSDRNEVRHAHTKVREEELSERADRRDKRAEQLEAEVAKLRRQVSDAERKEKAARERMLEP